jgi:hypothetical protein
MSEAEYEHPELPEVGPVGVDDVLSAIQQKNIAQAKAAFGKVMGQKVNDALESEKVKLAGQIFNNLEPEESEEPEAELEDGAEEQIELELGDEQEEDAESY